MINARDAVINSVNALEGLVQDITIFEAEAFDDFVKVRGIVRWLHFPKGDLPADNSVANWIWFTNTKTVSFHNEDFFIGDSAFKESYDVYLSRGGNPQDNEWNFLDDEPEISEQKPDLKIVKSDSFKFTRNQSNQSV